MNDSLGSSMSAKLTIEQMQALAKAHVGRAPTRSAAPSYKRIRLRQGSDSWLSWRDSGIGASDAPSIMGENRWKSRTRLLDEKLGGVRSAQNAAMAKGSALEPDALKRFTKETGIEAHPVCLESTRCSWLHASLDGLSPDGKVVVEIKCGSSAYRHANKFRQPPTYYKGQLQHILAITGLSEIHYWNYLPGKDPIHLLVSRDEAYITRLFSEEQKFWKELVARR